MSMPFSISGFFFFLTEISNRSKSISVYSLIGRSSHVVSNLSDLHRDVFLLRVFLTGVEFLWKLNTDLEL